MTAIEPTHTLELRDLTRHDLDRVAAVHIDSFPESALTKLGLEIVQRYYLWQLTGPHRLVSAVGAFLDEECAGFSFSGEFVGSLSGFLEKNRSFLIRQVILHPWLILNSLFLKRLVRGVQVLNKFARKKDTAEKPQKASRASYGILSIAVSNKHQKLGIGKKLMLDAEERARQNGYKQMHLTVSPENGNAIRFYENLGWQKVEQGPVWKGSMIKKLD